MRKSQRITWIVLVVLVLVYLSGPFIASVYEIGDSRGPKIYPESLHEFIYEMVWDLTEHEGNAPRLPAVWKSEHRPWFYGRYSKNSDPIWIDAETKKLWTRLNQERDSNREEARNQE